MTIFYIKALHIIFVVTWFAGLFYIVRLFIYHAEAGRKKEPERSILQKQFRIMQRRLWFGITWPSAVLTVIFGVWMLILRPDFLENVWMYAKLGIVVLLLLYHFYCERIYRTIGRGITPHSPLFLRFFNEGATIFLFSIVFLVVLKDRLEWVWWMIGVTVLILALIAGIWQYKRSREKATTQAPEDQE